MFHKIVDLTHTLSAEIPTWSGGCGYRLETKLDYPTAGLRVQSLRCHAGVGTHLDAPSHFFSQGKNVADIEIQDCLAPLCVLSMPKVTSDFFLTKEQILVWEDQWGKILPRSFFAFHTGWDRFWKEPELYRNCGQEGKMHFPGFHKSAAELLMERDVVGIGIDTLSPDGSNNGIGADTYPVHQILLGNGKYIVENLTCLEKMAPRGEWILIAPPKAGDATEYTCRAVGLGFKKEI